MYPIKVANRLDYSNLYRYLTTKEFNHHKPKRRTQMKTIYSITLLETGKSYIGCTQDLRHRMYYHKSRTYKPKALEYNYPLHVDIRAQKNGWKDIYLKTLGVCADKDALHFEKEAILKHKTYLPDFGYNQLIGRTPTKEASLASSIRQKEWAKEHPISEETRQKMAYSNLRRQPVICYTYEGGELVGNYISFAAAAKELGMRGSDIGKVISGVHARSHKYYFIKDDGSEIQSTIKVPPFLYAYDFKTGAFIGDYLSVKHACKAFGFDFPGIYNCLKGKQKQTHGIVFTKELKPIVRFIPPAVCQGTPIVTFRSSTKDA